MCRFVAYLGKPIYADELIMKPKNSLMKQSYHALEAEITVNGDGFGLGWYNHARRDEPALYRSIRPAWNDENLSYNAPMIYTDCLFAHIRAATQGGVSIHNSHPFQYKQYLMMQNGGIMEFHKIKRKLINLLDEDVFNWIDGQTDTQYTFALFITLAERLRADKGKLSFDDIHGCLNETFAIIEGLKKEADVKAPSVYNLVLTDGKLMIATRYSTMPEVETRSLHLAMNAQCYICEEGNLTLKDQAKEKEGILISSERLTENKDLWTEVPENHFIMVEEDLSVRLKELD